MKMLSKSDELKHFGIPGMRWGVRKGPNRVNIGKKPGAASEWLKEAGQLTKNNLRHPILADRANRASIAAEKTLGSKLRRSLVVQNTKDLKDVNARLDKAIAQKKAEKEHMKTILKKYDVQIKKYMADMDDTPAGEKAWNEAKKLRAQMGTNAVQRFFNANLASRK